MNPIALAGPAVEPISLAEMKAYLRLDGTDEDDLVSALIVAARVSVELRTRSCLISQNWRYALSAWPAERRVGLPLHPVIMVDAVTVSTSEGEQATLASELIQLEADGDRSLLVISAAAPDPAGLPPRIEVDFTCGYGPDPESVPEPLRLAIRRLVAYWFEHRGDERRPGQASVPSDVVALTAPFTRPRLA